MVSITHDLRWIDIDDEGYARAVAAARSFKLGDAEASFAFTGTATLMFQRIAQEWSPHAFNSTPLIRSVDPVQGVADPEAAQDPAFLQVVSDQVTLLHVPVQCQDMVIDDVWGVDCEFLLLPMPHPQDAQSTAWLLVPGPHGRVVSSRQTVQDYQLAALQEAAQSLGLQEDPDATPVR